MSAPTGISAVTSSSTSPVIRQGRRAVVFGASGFLGGWLVKELLEQGVHTTAAIRSAASAQRLTTWLEVHGTPTGGLRLLLVDLAVDGLGVSEGAMADAQEIYNCAGAYAFGMSRQQARDANVDTVRRVVAFSAALNLTRLVHVSGYRVGGQDPASVPWSPEHSAEQYRRLGAFEASKVESDATVQAAALELGVPLSVVNPSTVIGDSSTGESDQTLGLATTVLDLLTGRLRAIPGSSNVFVPVVTVDYLTRFMTLLPTVSTTAGASYWVLDPETPPLPDLLRLVAAHHQLKAPRLRLPVTLIKHLPRGLTHADPEMLGFLSTDRYPTGPAEDLARAHDLHHGDVTVSLRRWSDHLLLRHQVTLPTHPQASPTPAKRLRS